MIKKESKMILNGKFPVSLGNLPSIGSAGDNFRLWSSLTWHRFVQFLNFFAVSSQVRAKLSADVLHEGFDGREGSETGGGLNLPAIGSQRSMVQVCCHQVLRLLWKLLLPPQIREICSEKVSAVSWGYSRMHTQDIPESRTWNKKFTREYGRCH